MSPQYLSPGVYVEEVDRGSKPIEGVGTSVAGFVGFAAKGPINRPTFIANWSQFTQTFGDFLPGAYLAHAVYGYFNNGGGGSYIMRLPSGKADEAAPSVATALLPGREAPEAIEFTAKEEGPAGEGITVTIVDADEGKINVAIALGDKLETYEGVTGGAGKASAVAVINKASELVTAKSIKADIPVAGAYKLAVPTTTELTKVEVQPDVYVGDASERSGIGGFEAVDEITILCAPDLMSAYQSGALSRDGVKAVQLAMMAHCELMGDRVAILDPLPDMSPQEVKEWRQDEAGYDSKYAALYYPWIKMANPSTGAPIYIPPGGHMAGIWARSDTERGVHKAPANEIVRGALGLQMEVTKAEQDLLNPIGVNCIRAFRGRGIRVWGARTLSSDPSWRYLNVRRLFNFIEESIEMGTQWVVFEPNDLDLWQRVKRTITAFLTRVWRDGALFGATPDEAFYVKCDEELNPPEVRDAGQLIIEIGLAPVKPAEFVIFRISQWQGGGGVEE